MKEKYFTAKELAERYGVSRATIYEWRRRGVLPEGQKIGWIRRWSLSEIRRWERESRKAGKV